MALAATFCSGFETGLIPSTNNLLGFGAAAPAGMAISTLSPRNGGYCLRDVHPANTAGNLTVNTTAANKLSVRLGFRLTTRPASGTATLCYVNATVALTIFVSSAGVLTAQCGAGTAQTGPTITDTNWHLAELVFDTSSTAYSLDWKIDSTQFTQATVTSTALASRLSIGTQSAAEPTHTFDYDDLLVGTFTGTPPTGDFWGDGKVIAQLPGSDGTHSFTTNDFSTGDAGTQRAPSFTTFWTFLDTVPPWSLTRDATNNIAQRVVNTAGYVEILPSTTAETGVANCISSSMLYSSASALANTAALILLDSPRTNSGTMFGDLPVGQGGFGGALADWSENPANFGKTFTSFTPVATLNAATINSLRWRFGGSNDISPVPTLQALVLEVDWPVVPAVLLPDVVMAAPNAIRW